MLNEIILTSVEKLERIINRHLRKWLGVPLSFISIELYSKIAKLQLPLTSVVEEFKAEKARFVMTLRIHLMKRYVRTAGVEVKKWQKWSAAKQ